MGMDMGTLMSLLMSNRSGGMGPPPIDVNKYFNPNGGPCPPGGGCKTGEHGGGGGADMNSMLMQMLMTNMMKPQTPPGNCSVNDRRPPPPPPPRPCPPPCGFAPVSPWCGHEVLFYLNLLCRGCLVRF